MYICSLKKNKIPIYKTGRFIILMRSKNGYFLELKKNLIGLDWSFYLFKKDKVLLRGYVDC